MNAIDFTNELNALIGRALKEGVDKRCMSPSDLIGSLEIQKIQMIMIFQQQVVQRMLQQQAGAILVPRNGGH